MKKCALTLSAVLGFVLLAHAGPEAISSKDVSKTVAPEPCAEWYRNNEWNVSLWGTYAFSGTDYNRSGKEETDDAPFEFGSYDRFLAKDHAWGGGMDVKYFFRRYFGIGVEGFAIGARSSHAVMDHPPDNANEEFIAAHDHTVGGVLGTFTLRYPIHCSRFSPYAWAGVGGVFGGYNDRGLIIAGESQVANDDESRLVGQFGGGMEVRVTPHISFTGDFSWNVVDGTKNNYGMARSGLNFSF
jgi:opacity protein-like surface antigen